MSAGEYWEGDAGLPRAYYRANELRIQRRSEEMWLQGLYNYRAFSVVIGNVFKKKGAKAEKYLEEPIRLIPLTEEEKREKAKREREKVIAYFNGLQKKFEKDKNVPSV